MILPFESFYGLKERCCGQKWALSLVLTGIATDLLINTAGGFLTKDLKFVQQSKFVEN